MDIDHSNAPDDPDPNNQTTGDDSSSISSDSSAEFDEIISRSRRRRLVAVMTMSIVAAAMEVANSTSQMIGEPITSEDPPAQGWENADDNIAPPTLPPPTPSPSKRRFSTLASESIDSSSQSAIPSPSTAITGGSPISRSAVSSSSGRAKRGRMTGAIAISSLGHELSDIKGLLRMEIESTKSNLDAREERKRWEMERSEHNHPRQIQNQPMPMDPMLNAIERMQELDSDLSPDDQATLADLFNEDTGSAKTYLALKTDPVRKAWIQRKLKHMRTSALAG